MKVFDLTQNLKDRGEAPVATMMAFGVIKIYAGANDNGTWRA